MLGDPMVSKQRRRCQRAWTFERVAGYEMKTKPKKRLIGLASKEQCMEACLLERDFECRSANWFRQTNECTLSDQDRHSVSQSEAGDQHINKLSLNDLYGPSNLTMLNNIHVQIKLPPPQTNNKQQTINLPPSSSLYQNYYYSNIDTLLAGNGNNKLLINNNNTLMNDLHNILANNNNKLHSKNDQNDLFDLKVKSKRSTNGLSDNSSINYNKFRRIRQLFDNLLKFRLQNYTTTGSGSTTSNPLTNGRLSVSYDYNTDNTNNWPPMQYSSSSGSTLTSSQTNGDSNNNSARLPVNAAVDYLENNCIYEPNKLCEFRKIQNRVLKTVDSIYQDVNSLEECKQKCLNAPYRCYSFDYGDTSERVCRTSHLDQASLLSIKDPYLDVMGAITYELASCFNVSIQCRAKEMVAFVSSSKMFKGKIYVKSRPASCVNDVRESLKFELTMPFNDQLCDVQMSSNSQKGVFSNDIIIQHHDRIVTTQDVGLSVYCQYDLGNKSITNNVDLAIEKFDDPSSSSSSQVESKTKPDGSIALASNINSISDNVINNNNNANSPLTITSLATTVVKSPNVTMRITNMNGQPVSSATVGDRLALLFEIKEKTSKYHSFAKNFNLCLSLIDFLVLFCASCCRQNHCF